MSKPPSDKPPEKPTEETVAPSVPEPDQVKPEFSPFGLSAKQFATVYRAMLAAARSVCRHPGAPPEDAVQQAFVKALSKPSSDQPSIQDEKKFVAYMSTLARLEAQTNRQSCRRRGAREVVSDEDVAEMVSVAPSVGPVEARKMLESALMTLKPEQRALLQAIYAEGKTIKDVAGDEPASTVGSRHKRILALLHAAMKTAVAALVLLVPKKARAFVANITPQAPHMLAPAIKFGGVMMVPVVCGVLLPTSSSAMGAPSIPVGFTTYNISQTTIAQAADLGPSFFSEVEPEEPKALDTETNQCSDADMKSTKIASFLQETLIPVAFVVAPALTQVACTGTTQQTPPARQADDEAAEARAELQEVRAHYRAHCLQQQARGKKCETWEEWHKE